MQANVFDFIGQSLLFHCVRLNAKVDQSELVPVYYALELTPLFGCHTNLNALVSDDIPLDDFKVWV